MERASRYYDVFTRGRNHRTPSVSISEGSKSCNDISVESAPHSRPNLIIPQPTADVTERSARDQSRMDLELSLEPSSAPTHEANFRDQLKTSFTNRERKPFCSHASAQMQTSSLRRLQSLREKT